MIGVERDPEIAEIARRNFAANGVGDAHVITADVETDAVDIAPVDHAMANPPYHSAVATPSPNDRRRAAKQGSPELLGRWSQGMAVRLRRHGTLSFILRAADLSQACSAMLAAGCGSLTLFPLWPKPGCAAKLIILRGVKGGHSPTRILAGLSLHEPEGGFSIFANNVLRDGAALRFQDDRGAECSA